MNKALICLPWISLNPLTDGNSFAPDTEFKHPALTGDPSGLPSVEECGGCSEDLLQEQARIATELLQAKMSAAMEELMRGSGMPGDQAPKVFEDPAKS